MSNPTTTNPASRSRAAMALPIRPRPTMPTGGFASIVALLLRLDAGLSHFAGPLGDFGLDELRELIGRHRRRLQAEVAEPRLDVRLGEAPRDDVVELRHRRGRRAGWRDEAIPDARLETGKGIGD